MKRNSRVFLAGIVTIAWAGALVGARGAAAPKVWIVDDDGGNGVHFTNIPAAVTAAVDGDVIRVRTGVYSGFTLNEALTIVGEAGARLNKGTRGIEIQAPPGRVTVAHLKADFVEVLDAPHTVVLERLTITGDQPAPSAPLGSPYGGTVYVRGSSDVRIHRAKVTGFGEWWAGGHGHSGIRITSSRVEIVDSTIVTADGLDGDHCNEQIGGNGGTGISIDSSSRVHVALTSATAADGGDLINMGLGCGIGYGGDGGHGIETHGNVGQVSDLIVTGTDADFVDAGDAGSAPLAFGYCGAPGDGMHVSGGTLRWSSITRFRGQGCGTVEGQAISSNGTAVTKPSLPDPSLERTAPTATSFANPGQTTLTVHAPPGIQVTMLLGRVPLVQEDPTVVIELLVDPVGVFRLGAVPGSGQLNYDIPLGPAWPKALLGRAPVFFAQAELLYPGGEVRRTNSIPIVLQVQ